MGALELGAVHRQVNSFGGTSRSLGSPVLASPSSLDGQFLAIRRSEPVALIIQNPFVNPNDPRRVAEH